MGGQLICGFMHGESTYFLMEVSAKVFDCLVQKYTQRQKWCHLLMGLFVCLELIVTGNNTS